MFRRRLGCDTRYLGYNIHDDVFSFPFRYIQLGNQQLIPIPSSSTEMASFAVSLNSVVNVSQPRRTHFQSLTFINYNHLLLLSNNNIKNHRSFQVSCDHSCSFNAKDITYRPPGTQINLLNDVTFTLPHKSFGLIFGRSGSGKTTLLQLIAGLSKPTSGSIYIQRYTDDGTPIHPPVPLSPERVGIVFQFPERYFVADNVFDEITFGLPRQKSDLKAKELIAGRLERAITSVGLNGIALDKNPNSLSGGYKRRLALAVQLVQTPELLVLDEPLAGLDWKARADVVKLLKNLKKELTILVVSHDLKELTPLVDKSWRMDVGGLLKEEPLPM